ncbi:MAG TPA: hypothetical protein VLS89_13070 [Candidatus Nanopelagicales bacterium]|nr:hypothetical protein [Candidatus Nanopelagicales bacterium]
MGLHDVAWNPVRCCIHCRRAGDEDDAPGVEEEMEPEPKSGVVVRLSVEITKRRRRAHG